MHLIKLQKASNDKTVSKNVSEKKSLLSVKLHGGLLLNRPYFGEGKKFKCYITENNE